MGALKYEEGRGAWKKTAIGSKTDRKDYWRVISESRGEKKRLRRSIIPVDDIWAEMVAFVNDHLPIITRQIGGGSLSDRALDHCRIQQRSDDGSRPSRR